jgi:hypothetical protein
MPVSYVIDVEQRLVRSRAWGVLSDEDLITHYRAIAADPLFEPTFSQLGDLRDVTGVSLNATTIRSESTLLVFDRAARRALVASSDLAFGISRMYAQQAEAAPQNIQVFRDMREAERWLALTAP